MNRKMIIGVVALCGLCLAAQATTTDPTYQLSFTTSGGNWFLWCQQEAVTLPNDGLASFVVSLAGLNGTTILTSRNWAPAVYDPDDYGIAGFWYAPYSDGSIGVDGLGRSIVSGIAATQWTFSPYPPSNILKGFGQVAGSLPFWGGFTCPAMLARGTFAGPGVFAVTSATGTALNFNWSGPDNVTPVVFTPEPMSLSLLALGGLALLRRRR